MLILAICCMSLFIVGPDSTIVNVALPSIGHDLHSSVSGLQWTIDAYLLVLASLLMFSGSTADRIGRRRTFQAGLALFTLGSLLCSLAPGLGWLVAFRMLQRWAARCSTRGRCRSSPIPSPMPPSEPARSVSGPPCTG
jgi:MFS family permease